MGTYSKRLHSGDGFSSRGHYTSKIASRRSKTRYFRTMPFLFFHQNLIGLILHSVIIYYIKAVTGDDSGVIVTPDLWHLHHWPKKCKDKWDGERGKKKVNWNYCRKRSHFARKCRDGTDVKRETIILLSPIVHYLQ